MVSMALIVPMAVLLSDSESWIRSGTVAHILWWADEQLPFSHRLPHSLRLIYLSVIAVLLGLAVLTLIQQRLLRLLLTYKGWLWEGAGKPSKLIVLWAMVVKVLSGREQLMLGFQACLPRQPVPSLRATTDRFLQSVRPLLTQEQFGGMTERAHAFLAAEGPRLQRWLILKSWYPLTPNYVSDWWEKYVYLRSRTPIMINSNYYVIDCNVTPRATQVARAANLSWEFLRFRQQVEREQIAPQKLRDVIPLCMQQHERIFNTTRIPGRDHDSLHHLTNAAVKHIAVLCRRRWYKVRVTHQRTGRPLTILELEDMLQRVMLDAHDPASPKPSWVEAHFPALTAGERTHWAVAREQFFSAGVNKRSLSVIEEAAFVLVLDEARWDRALSAAHSLFHGDAADRWFDKSLTLVVYADGKAGLNCEHSWADAPVTGHLWETCANGDMLRNPYDEAGCIARTPRLLAELQAAEKMDGGVRVTPPHRLKWDMGHEEAAAEAAVRVSLNLARAMIDNIDLRVLEFSGYGKGLIKKFRLSPDGFIQMCLQLAYFRDSGGQFALTYESALSRLFRCGRTETVRSLSVESSEFVRAMEDKGVANATRRELLKAAVEHHQTTYRLAMSGEGIDRHLFALYVVSQGMNIESPFLQDVLTIPWKLSTSQTPQMQTTEIWAEFKRRGLKDIYSPGGGFGPVHEDGYGVSYMVPTEDILLFHVTSLKSSPHTLTSRFIAHIRTALEDMRNIFASD